MIKITLPSFGAAVFNRNSKSLRIVIKKDYGSAVKRNRLRRRIKEAIRDLRVTPSISVIYVDSTTKIDGFSEIKGLIEESYAKHFDHPRN